MMIALFVAKLKLLYSAYSPFNSGHNIKVNNSDLITFYMITEGSKNSPQVTDFENFSTLAPFNDAILTRSTSKRLKTVDDTNEEIVVDNDSDDDVELKRHKIDSNVHQVNGSNVAKVGRLILSDDNLDAMTFVEDAVKNIGFKLDVEEVHPGVYYPLAQKLLFVVRIYSQLFLSKKFKYN